VHLRYVYLRLPTLLYVELILYAKSKFQHLT